MYTMLFMRIQKNTTQEPVRWSLKLKQDGRARQSQARENLEERLKNYCYNCFKYLSEFNFK